MTQVLIDVMFGEGADREVPLPVYQTPGAAGADLHANLAAADRADGVVLHSGARALVPTGLHMTIPAGFEVQIRPRSGLALKNGIGMVNAPGTIDSDFRGPVGVLLVNHGQDDFTVTHGMRIAQMVVAPVFRADFAVVDALADTARGAGGFGSTGNAL